MNFKRECDHSFTIENETEGITVCTQCGALLEDCIIVSHPQFVDNKLTGSSQKNPSLASMEY